MEIDNDTLQQKAASYADRLVERHGLERAISYAYNHGFGLHEPDAKRLELGAAHGDKRVLKARLALDILRDRHARENGLERGERGVFHREREREFNLAQDGPAQGMRR